MQSNKLLELVQTALNDLKAQDVTVIDVHEITKITDYMVIASGSSNRHVRSVADHLVEIAKQQGYEPIGVEGHEYGEWVLVDLDDVVVHVMQPVTRDFYKLENLWSIGKNPTKKTSTQNVARDTG